MKLGLWLPALLVVAASAGTAGEASDLISMRITPRQAFAPTNLRVSIRIEPSTDNRSVVVVADAPEFYRSSEIPLEGDRAPRVVTVEFRGVPGGEYEISGTLMNSMGSQRASVRGSARVLAVGDETPFSR